MHYLHMPFYGQTATFLLKVPWHIENGRHLEELQADCLTFEIMVQQEKPATAESHVCVIIRNI
jgi:hypothetical protein